MYSANIGKLFTEQENYKIAFALFDFPLGLHLLQPSKHYISLF